MCDCVLQVNDLTELHQNEMENLKTTMTDMEEKVQYQSEERVRDLHEMLENCHTRVCLNKLICEFFPRNVKSQFYVLIATYCY